MSGSDGAVDGSAAARKLAVYANVGAELFHFDVDVEAGKLTKRSVTTIPASVQYAWPHASGRFLYIASSNRQAGDGKQHFLSACSIDPKTGELSPHGRPVQLPARPIHLSTDIPSEHVLVAFAVPSGLRVYRINKDFSVGEEIPQPGLVDGGNYAHQIRVTPGNKHAILADKGPSPQYPAAPGSLKVFDYENGVVSNEESVTENGGRHFTPRHIDFHPTKPWVYVSIEVQSQIGMYRMVGDGRLAETICHRKTTLTEPDNVRPRQITGPIHVHPNGRLVYIANRADAKTEVDGRKLFQGGENSIAIFSIDQDTGEPTLVRNIDTLKIHPRTFHIDPEGRLMVVQHNLPATVRKDGFIRDVPAGLTVFRVSEDGHLSFLEAHDFDVGTATMWWMGMVAY